MLGRDSRRLADRRATTQAPGLARVAAHRRNDHLCFVIRAAVSLDDGCRCAGHVPAEAEDRALCLPTSAVHPGRCQLVLAWRKSRLSRRRRPISSYSSGVRGMPESAAAGSPVAGSILEPIAPAVARAEGKLSRLIARSGPPSDSGRAIARSRDSPPQARHEQRDHPCRSGGRDRRRQRTGVQRRHERVPGRL